MLRVNGNTVLAMDGAKNLADTKGIIDLDAVPPETPSINLSGDAQANEKNPNVTRLQKPTFEGTTEAGAKIEIWLNGVKIDKSVLADDQGNWSFTPDTAWDVRTHKIKIIAIDERGNPSDPVEYGFKIDNDIGEFTARIKDKDNSSRSIEEQIPLQLNITNHPTPGFEGIAKPRSRIIVSDQMGRTVTVDVNEKGEWALTEMPSIEGENRLIFRIIDPYGNEATHELKYVIKTSLPVAPTEVSLDDHVEINHIQSTKNTTPTLKGKAQPHSWILIYEDENSPPPLARVQVNGDGLWSHTFLKPLDSRAYKMKFTAQDQAGNVSEKSVTLDVHIQTEMEVLEACLADESRSQKHPQKWKTHKTKGLVLEGITEANASIKVKINGKEYFTQADAEGRWRVLPDDLKEGHYRVEVSSKNKLDLSIDKAYSLVIKDRIEEPVIGILADARVEQKGGQVITSHKKPKFIVKGEPGSEVRVSFYSEDDKTTPMFEKTGVISKSGELVFSSEDDLPVGKYHVKVILSDDLGNQSELSEDYIFEVLTVVNHLTIELDHPTSLSGDNPHITKNNAFVLRGSGTSPYAKINLYRGDNILPEATITAGENGNWSHTVTDITKDGLYDFHIKT